MPPGADIKVPAFLLIKFAYKNFKMKEDHVLRLFEDIRINETSRRSQLNTHKLKWVLFFIVDY